MGDTQRTTGGIYDHFQGFRVPTEDDLSEALRSALVVVDANVLLNLYRYNDVTCQDLLGVLERLENRLWVPHQVMREFWRNRLSVLASRSAATDQTLSALQKQQRGTVEAIKTWAKSTAVVNSQRRDLINKIEQLYADLSNVVAEHGPATDSVAAGAVDDPVLASLEKLLHGKVGSPLTDEDWRRAVDVAKGRVARREPPGYLDADKAESDLPEGAAGDYLVWFQVLQEAAHRKTDVLIVTGDEKEDWWWRHRSDFLGPRQELVGELVAHCGAQLYMMRPIDLLRSAPTLKLVVSQDSVDDAERVGKRAEWTAAGVRLLLDRLDMEGRAQANVIRVAASSGGSIQREAVYAVCGYAATRMLRGFTRPVARITSDLQQEGLVPDNVETALVAIYDGGVQATKFQVPPDVVAILGGAATDAEDTKDAEADL